jgi:hypothetical protein
MPLRVGESGQYLASLLASMTPAAITAPNQNVQTVTDTMFAGAKAVVATFGAAAPGANLLIGGAFVSNAATGQISVRFLAVGANYVSAAESILIQQLL